MEILGPTRKGFRRGKQEFMMNIPLASLPNMLSYRHKIKSSLFYKHLLNFREKIKWNWNTSEVLLKHFLPKVDRISAFECVSFSDNPSVSWLARCLELTGLWITLETEGVWMLICGPLTPHICECRGPGCACVCTANVHSISWNIRGFIFWGINLTYFPHRHCHCHSE